jgi:hypothetical protein
MERARHWRHNRPAMIYKFKSKASGDLVMLAPQGDRLLQLLGREPAAKGIFEVAAMPGLLQRLEAALAEADAGAAAAEEPTAEPAVGLRQRLWPMIEMLRRCQAAGEPIVWGV